MKRKIIILGMVMLLTGLFFSACTSGTSPDGIVYSPVTGIRYFNLTSPEFTRASIDRTNHTIKLYLSPSFVDLTALSPVISLTSGYSISPDTDVAQDFSGGKTVTYTLTDPDGLTTDYVAQALDETTSAETVNGWLGKGINLGNDLDAWPGVEGSWTGGVVADASFFDDYVAAGFESVRIPITWSSRLGTSAPYTINSTFMTRVTTVVDWGLSKGLTVVINAHHEDWIRKMDHATYISTVGIEQKTRFIAMWRQIAENFASKDAHLVFEILNEPQGDMTNEDVVDLHAAALAVIRESNPDRTVMLGANSWSSMTALQQSSFSLPSDAHLIATFHSYDPWSFAGEASGTWGTASDITNMNNGLATVAAWAATNHVPLYMGEYGATKYKKNGSGAVIGNIDAASRLKWYTEMAKAAVSKGISYACWDDYGDFKLYDRAAGTFDTSITDVILNP